MTGTSTTIKFKILHWKVAQSFSDVSDKGWTTFRSAPKKGEFIIVVKIPFYLLIICASSCLCLHWHLLEKLCALHRMYTSFLKCAVHSTLRWFPTPPPLLGTEVKTPVDSSIHLIGSVSLNQPVMELMAVCHPWRYKFPGGVSCRQCMKYALCASKDW